MAEQMLTRSIFEEEVRKAVAQGKGKAGAKLKLTGRSLTGIESLEGVMPELRWLEVSNNKLTSFTELKAFPLITFLKLDSNKLTGDSLDGISALKQLQVLNASHNQIEKLKTRSFAKLKGLQALILNDNSLTDIPVPVLQMPGLASLNTLVLSQNRLTSLPSSGLSSLTSLSKLSASNNEITELPDLSCCVSMKELRLAHNKVTSLNSSLSKMPRLRTLDLGHNDLSASAWEYLSLLKDTASLMHLTLTGNPLAELDGESYIAKMGEFFPRLRVRDGHRIIASSYIQQQQQQQQDDEAGAKAQPDDEERGAGAKRGDGNAKVKSRKRKLEAGTMEADDAGLDAKKGKKSGGKVAKETAPKKPKKGGDDQDERGGHRDGDRSAMGDAVMGSAAAEAKAEGPRKKKKEKGKEGKHKAGVDVEKGDGDVSEEAEAGSGAHVEEEEGTEGKKEKLKKTKKKKTKEGGEAKEATETEGKKEKKKKKHNTASELEGKAETGKKRGREEGDSVALVDAQADGSHRGQEADRDESGEKVEQMSESVPEEEASKDKKKKTSKKSKKAALQSGAEDGGGGAVEKAAKKAKQKGAEKSSSDVPVVDIKEAGVIEVVNVKRRGKAGSDKGSKTADQTGKTKKGGIFSVEEILKGKELVGTGGVGAAVSAWD